jgi:hypothetical protein
MGYRMTIAARLMLESYRIKRAQGAASMAVPPT